MSILRGNRLGFQGWLLAGLWAVAGLAVQIAIGGEAKEAKPAASEPELSDLPVAKWLPKPYAIPNAEAKTEAEMKPYTEALVNSDIKFDLVPIRGGKFKMGSPPGEKGRKDDEGPQVEVVIDPFWMGKCEVTWEEYETWSFELDRQIRKAKQLNSTEWDKLADAIARPTKPYTDMTFDMGKTGRPAICMTHYSAQMYCKWLSAKTGRYYRLPTEAEWEYACRAGRPGPYGILGAPAVGQGNFNTVSNSAQAGGWAQSPSDGFDSPSPAASFLPNRLGLFDMHGNAWEWCADWYEAGSYRRSASVDPTGPSQGSEHVMRGGSWRFRESYARSANRAGMAADWCSDDVGFRVALDYAAAFASPGLAPTRCP